VTFSFDPKKILLTTYNGKNYGPFFFKSQVFFYPPPTSEAGAADIRAFEQGYPVRKPCHLWRGWYFYDISNIALNHLGEKGQGKVHQGEEERGNKNSYNPLK